MAADGSYGTILSRRLDPTDSASLASLPSPPPSPIEGVFPSLQQILAAFSASEFSPSTYTPSESTLTGSSTSGASYSMAALELLLPQQEERQETHDQELPPSNYCYLPRCMWTAMPNRHNDPPERSLPGPLLRRHACRQQDPTLGYHPREDSPLLLPDSGTSRGQQQYDGVDDDNGDNNNSVDEDMTFCQMPCCPGWIQRCLLSCCFKPKPPCVAAGPSDTTTTNGETAQPRSLFRRLGSFFDRMTCPLSDDGEEDAGSGSEPDASPRGYLSQRIMLPPNLHRPRQPDGWREDVIEDSSNP